MRVTFKNSCMVKPSEPTWSGKMILSELDQTGFTAHVKTIYFYKHSPEDWDTALETLKTSLSSVLVHFYPLAGRLHFLPGGRLELDCNAAGAQFIEAYADVKLIDMESLLPAPTYYQQLILAMDYLNSTLEEIPLLLLQVTRFLCGAVSISFSMSHYVTDGHGAFHFISEWARFSRGELLESPPFLDRKFLRAGDPPTGCPTFEHPEFDPQPVLICSENQRDEENTVMMLKLTSTQVEKLRNQANKSQTTNMSRGFSRYEAITGHIWKTLCKVRNHVPEQPTALTISVDIRNKVRPPLPKKYFGNSSICVLAIGTTGEICSKPLGHVSRKIRETIEKVNDEYVNSAINLLKTREDLSPFQPANMDVALLGNPNVGVVSWITLPSYGMDLGWGKEIHMALGTHDFDGDALILRGKDGEGSLVVALMLQVKQMENFMKIFYEEIDHMD